MDSDHLKAYQERMEDAQSSILGAKKAWKHPSVEYFTFFFKKNFKMQISFINKDNTRLF